MSSSLPPRRALVVTTIAEPTPAMIELAQGCVSNGIQCIVIGDTSGPATFDLPGCRFIDMAEQAGLGLRYGRLCPTRSYARKNIGYLLAWRDGADILIETDDDNFPLPQFWTARVRRQDVPCVHDAGWVNVYRYFTAAPVWPRGFSLADVNSSPLFEGLVRHEEDCPIQQGLADDNPDVDAIYRLVMPLPVRFRTDRRLALAKGCWCPFNSQNTTWWREVAPLLYLPASCSFRMTDIWRSFVAQRIVQENGWSILFHEPTVRQDRNQHDLLRDFADEVPGYLNNAVICEALGRLPLRAGTDHLGDNLRICYARLVGMGHLDGTELDLLEAWLDDLAQIETKAPPD